MNVSRCKVLAQPARKHIATCAICGWCNRILFQDMATPCNWCLAFKFNWKTLLEVHKPSRPQLMMVRFFFNSQVVATCIYSSSHLVIKVKRFSMAHLPNHATSWGGGHPNPYQTDVRSIIFTRSGAMKAY